jgi:hypothetical protein
MASPMRAISLRRHGQGFSYLWVLLTVALLGLGLTVAAEVDAVAAQRDRERELLAIGRQFRTAIGRYYETQLVAGKREYPAALEDLLSDKRFPGTRRHLRKIFIDPMTGKAEWGTLRVGNRIVGVYSKSAVVPIKQAGFLPEDASLNGKKKISEWVFSYPPNLQIQVDASGQAVLPTTMNQVPPPVQIDGKAVPNIGTPLMNRGMQ